MPLLPPEAFDFAHSHALDTQAGQRFFDLVELERLDNRLDSFHLKRTDTSNRSKRVNKKSEIQKNFVEKNIRQAGAELTRFEFKRLLLGGRILAAAPIPASRGGRPARSWEKAVAVIILCS